MQSEFRWFRANSSVNSPRILAEHDDIAKPVLERTRANALSRHSPRGDGDCTDAEGLPLSRAEADRLAFAQETQRLAADLKNYRFRPWRWREWYRRRRRIIERRLAVLRTAKSIDETAAEQARHEEEAAAIDSDDSG